jgi:hypothetical protein
MLTTLTTGLSFRLAIILAALAALCFVMPPAALAFGHGEHTADCLAHADMVNHGVVAKHVGVNDHADHSAPAGLHQMTCCGLFCLSALPADLGEVVDRINTGSPILPLPERHPLSQGPSRPDRPPISLLFV